MARRHSIPRCCSKPADHNLAASLTVFRAPRWSAAGLIDAVMGFDNLHDRRNRARSTSSPVHSPNHHQPDSPHYAEALGSGQRLGAFPTMTVVSLPLSIQPVSACSLRLACWARYSRTSWTAMRLPRRGRHALHELAAHVTGAAKTPVRLVSRNSGSASRRWRHGSSAQFG
jgi:hypothetical protein